MDRDALMKSVVQRAFDARIELTVLCNRAQISPNAASRWQRQNKAPRLSTIGKLEAELDKVEREKLEIAGANGSGSEASET